MIKQSVLLDKAFVIGNGSGREVFYQTWSCRRSTRIAEGGVTGTSNANKQAIYRFWSFRRFDSSRN